MWSNDPNKLKKSKAINTALSLLINIWSFRKSALNLCSLCGGDAKGMPLNLTFLGTDS